MKVIGIIGSKLSGKETAAAYIAAQHRGTVLAHSDVLFEMLSVVHVESNRDNVIKLSALRETFGEDVLINALNHKISQLQTPTVVVTGIRFQNELDNIRNYPDNVVLAIHAPADVRFARQAHRAQRVDDVSMTYEQFLELEKRNTEIGIESLAKQADHVIENIGTLQEFHRQLDELLRVPPIQ